MAWRCSGSTNEELINRLRQNGLITSDRVAQAMRKVDRRNYVPSKGDAYEDCPQYVTQHQPVARAEGGRAGMRAGERSALPVLFTSLLPCPFPLPCLTCTAMRPLPLCWTVVMLMFGRIGFGATISAPHMHAHAAENLLSSLPAADFAGGAILDVGSGSGYLTAVFHHLAPHATVVGIDHIQGLVDMSRENLRKDGIKLGTGPGEVEIICGDGRLGSPRHAPFQVIHVGAAAPEVPPALVEQLARPGRMFIPVGEHSQDIWQIDKDSEGHVTEKKLFGVMYVPLTDAQKQWRG